LIDFPPLKRRGGFLIKVHLLRSAAGGRNEETDSSSLEANIKTVSEQEAATAK
jgi:hypothetical protein